MPDVDIVPKPEAAPSDAKAATESKEKPSPTKDEESAKPTEPKDSKQ